MHILRKLFLSLALVAGAALCHAGVVTYTPDNTTVFRNPERGFTEELSAIVSPGNPNVVKGELSASASSYWVTERMSLVMVLYNFNLYKSSDLPAAVLEGFDEDMQELRNYGMKCVLRFAYTEEESDKVDATPAWVSRHLEQLQPHLAANADVIYVLEAGFVGVWGEWYYTTNYTNESQQMNDKRRQVINALLANAPADRFILCRYPLIKIGYLGDEVPLGSTEAFSGTARARIGHHNDAFLNDYGNDGTYGRDGDGPSDDPVLRQYIATETLYVPNGGETNVESSSKAKKVYANAPVEMSAYHWSFCGRSYAEQVTSRWRSSGLFDTLNIHMGYRYNLLDATWSDEVEPEGTLSLTLRLRNVGYAPLYNARTAYIVMQGNGHTCRLPLQTDPRRWLPDGAVSTISEELPLPSDLAAGTYRLYLHLPDAYESLAGDPRYAIRMANTGMWDEATGWNDLNAVVTVRSSAQGVEDLNGEPLPLPQKRIENGIFYILMPNGTKYYSF